jgi:alpha-tubulin suppressor-like RCC1 family protein
MPAMRSRLVFATLLVAGCGGGGTTTFAIGGTVTGLAGTGLVLADNGGDPLTVTASGAFTFATHVAKGAAYAVTVQTQPSAPTQHCVVTDATGTATAEVNGVGVACTTTAFPIVGTVTDLVGRGLVLQDNGGDDLPITKDGAFVFSKLVPSGQPYAVTVKTQPTAPVQRCLVATASGTVGAAAAGVTVTCTTSPLRKIGGTVTGLIGHDLVLANTNGDAKGIAANGAFTFLLLVAEGDPYAVTVGAAPRGPDQRCTVTGGAGTVSGGDVTDIAVACGPRPLVITGDAFGCATRGDGSLWCWGDNSRGQVGDGSANVTVSTPIQVGALTTWAQLAAGANHACATRQDGTLWCWGGNAGGQLGDGTTTDRHQPTQVGADTTWATVAAGTAHTCALKTDGTLWCWGDNSAGQLGDNTTTSRGAPAPVGTSTHWIGLSAGELHTCGIQIDDSLWCWGGNSSGQLGDGTGLDHLAPTLVSGTWTMVAAGQSTTCGVQTDGTLWCWGWNGYGQVGDNTTGDRNAPVQVGAATTWRQIATGVVDACAVRADGTLWCWGGNLNGQLGDGTTSNQNLPAMVGAATSWEMLSAGFTGCANQTAGPIWCWGRNAHGQVGDGTTTDQLAPKMILP